LPLLLPFFRDLQDNNIREWDTSHLKSELPSLLFLNIKRNTQLVIDKDILALPDLKTVDFLQMVSFNRIETHCMLTRNITLRVLGIKWSAVYSPTINTFDPNACLKIALNINSKNFWNWRKTYDFHIFCKLKYHTKAKYDISDTGIYSVDIQDLYCWKTVNLVYIFTTIIAAVALVLNCFVIVTTLRSDDLLGSVAHVLVANIAGGDLLIAVYTIILTITRQSTTFDSFVMKQEQFCSVVGVINLAGLFISPFMTFMVTLERYFVIVYCMQTSMRITLKLAYIVMAVAWTFAISLAICLINVPTLSNGTDDTCVPMGDYFVNAVFYVALFLLFLYFVSLVLYCHIYFNVRSTTDKTIVQINITNVLFWLTPLIAIYCITSYMSTHYHTKKILWDCFSLTCLVTNSCLNPVLFSIRNEKFRLEFCKLLRHRRCRIHTQQRPTSTHKL